MVSASSHRERLDLCGEWELAFDRQGAGIEDGWARGHYPEAQAARVTVPAPWNVSFPGVEGVGFYRKRFALPGAWRERALELQFGGASYRAQAWLNGQYLGSHEGAYTPFRFDATSAARPGEDNELIVRVAGLSRTAAVDGQELRHAPASKQAWYYVYSGLWDDVGLLARPPVHLDSLRIEPDLRGERALVHVQTRNTHETACARLLTLRIGDGAGAVVAREEAALTVPAGASGFAFRIPLRRPAPWSPAHPHLYTLSASLEEAGGREEHDVLGARFGMRDFTVAAGQFYLNGEPIYLRGVLLQPNYPVTLIAPPDREMMARELSLVKAAGFNLVRCHLRPAPPGYLDLCDEMGVLIYAESPLAWIRDSPRLMDHGRREIEALIERDRNHPSVVIWGVYNENPSMTAVNGRDLVRYARGLDPTRVIVDDSGGTIAIDQDFGWVDRATMTPDRALEPEPALDVHAYVAGPVTPGVYEWLRTLGTVPPQVDIAGEGYGSAPVLEEFYRRLRDYRGKILLSELGYGGMADLDQVVAGYDRWRARRTEEAHTRSGSGKQRRGVPASGVDGPLIDEQEMRVFRDGLHAGFAERGLDRVFGSVAGLAAACQQLQAATNVRQVEAVLLNPRISGFILTQLNDVAWEFHAGLLDHWRQPKRAYYDLQRLLARPHGLVLHADASSVYAGEQARVALSVLNFEPLARDAEVTVRVLDPTGAAIAASRQSAPAREGLIEPGSVEVQTGAATGNYVIEAALSAGGEILAETSEGLWAVAPLEPEEQAMLSGSAVLPDGILLAAAPGSMAAAEWEDALAAVRGGQTMVVGALRPGDDVALGALRRQGLEVTLHLGFGSWMGCYHWIPEGPLFAGLPANTLAGDPYAEVSPRYSLSELGGRVLAGSLQNTQTRREPAAILWFSDIEVVRLGSGRLIFCQYRVFERAQTHPAAARLACNLLRLAADGGISPK